MPGDGILEMIDHHSDRAVYQQVADVIREQIASGELTAGAALPAFKTLALRYGVGIDVVKDAVVVLRNEGLLEVSRGRRARVRQARAVEVITAPPQARVSVRMPTPAERRELKIGEGVPILVVRCDRVEAIYAGDRSEIILRDSHQF
jgi:DNA-binding transcriptional regulator YhcF (GntR family)